MIIYNMCVNWLNNFSIIGVSELLEENEDEEIYCTLDEGGYVLDEDGQYVTDKEGKRVQLKPEEVEKFKNENLVEWF